MDIFPCCLIFSHRNDYHRDDWRDVFPHTTRTRASRVLFGRLLSSVSLDRVYIHRARDGISLIEILTPRLSRSVLIPETCVTESSLTSLTPRLYRTYTDTLWDFLYHIF